MTANHVEHEIGAFPGSPDGEDRSLLSATHRVLSQKTGLGHVFACLLWTVVIHLLWAWGMPAPSYLPQRHSGSL